MSKLSVLLVEDDNDLRALYKEAFERHHFEVYESGDGNRAVDVCLKAKPALVILDLLMPKQGGIATLRVLRSLPETKHIPIIILTALPNPEYRERAGAMVQGYYLKTQIKPHELVEKVVGLISPKK